jgi:integrase
MRHLNAPLQDFVESFFRSNYDLSQPTERWYRQNLREFVGFIELARGREARLSDLDKPMADAFLKHRSRVPTRRYPGGSPFATRAAATTVKRFANYLAQDGILTDAVGLSVLKHVRRGKVDDDVRRPLSDEETARVIAAASSMGRVARATVILGLGSGLRLNEMREARVADLDLLRGEFNVRPETSKFGRGRTTSLHPDVMRDLERYLRDRTVRNPDSPLLPTRTGGRYTTDGFGKVFERIRRQSGCRDFSAHLMRHTWATNFMRAPGASLLELKRQGGWQRWEQVERYSHAVPVQDRRAMPNPLHKTAFGQQPSARVSRLSSAG